MIASTKLAKAQRATQAGKKYGAANAEVFDHVKEDSASASTRRLFIDLSSEKGLCGGIRHSYVSEATRCALNNRNESPLVGITNVDISSPVMIIGDKSNAQLSRAQGKNLKMTFNQIGRNIPIFVDGAGVADLIIKSGVEFDSAVLVCNAFVSALSYEPRALESWGVGALKESIPFKWKITSPRTSQSFLMPTLPMPHSWKDMLSQCHGRRLQEHQGHDQFAYHEVQP